MNKIHCGKNEVIAGSMRISCGEVLAKLGKINESLILVSSDNNISPKFVKQFKNRSFDVGIAEQNQICIAAGLAHKGKTVVVSAIASHLLLNAYMQIRNAVCFPNLNVIIVGIGAGLSYGSLGYTHHSLEDIAIMNTLPNMKIYLPADAYEAREALIHAIDNTGPSYIRLGAQIDPFVYSVKDKPRINFDRPVSLLNGKDVLIFATGIGVFNSLRAAEKLKLKKIETEIININAVNLYDIKKTLSFVKKHKLILTVEEHYQETGIGAIIANALIEKLNVPFIKVGVKKEFCDFAGTREELLKYYGLDAQGIFKLIISMLKGGK